MHDSLNAYCLSHVKDVDGISSASLATSALRCDFSLTDYGSIIEDMAKVPSSIDRFILCDIGTNSSTLQSFIELISKIAKRADVTYIDHHYMPAKVKEKLRGIGIELIHDTHECSSILTFKAFENLLPNGAEKVALYGAVTDYMDDSPIASKLMERHDRHFILLEATLLSHAISIKGNDNNFLDMLVRELAKMKLPHEIDDVPHYALEQAKNLVRLSDQVKKNGKILRNIAYMETDEFSTGNIAKLLLGAFDKHVSISYKESYKGWYEVSVRATSSCKVHLGRLIGRISGMLGGSGGGHKRAAGCRVPKDKINELLSMLDNSL